MVGTAIYIPSADASKSRLGFLYGAAAGGTLGAQRAGGGAYLPVRGFNPIPPAMRPLPALDLQLTWLSLLADHGRPNSPHPFCTRYRDTANTRASAGAFAYRNLEMGLTAPASGFVGNALAQGFGAAASGAMFGCLCPGDPAETARLAGLAATVDHAREGVLCAMFVAAACSTLFATKRLSEAVGIALKMVPAESNTAACVRAGVNAALEAPAAPAEARKRIQQAAREPSHAFGPLNVGFFVYSLLAGRGSFGESVCLAASLGGDSAPLGVAVGGAMGILVGADGISDEWKGPLGDRLLSTADIRRPEDAVPFEALAQRMGEVAERIAREGAPATVGEVPALAPAPTPEAEVTGDETAPQSEPPDPLLPMKDSALCRPLWSLNPNSQIVECCGLRVTFDFQEPPVVYPGRSNKARITVENLGDRDVSAEPSVTAPNDWTLACRPQPALLRPGSAYEFCVVAQSPSGHPPERGRLALRIGDCSFEAALLRPNGWMVVGPFPNPEGTAFDKHYRAEDVYGRDEVFMLRSNLPGKWQPRWVEGPWVPLAEDFGDSPGVVYLRTIVVSAEARPVRIIAATDDGLVLWVNREKKLWYHDHHEAVPLPKPPYITSAELRRGDNELMLKVLRCLHPCRGVWVYLVDDRGSAPADLVFDETRA
ncbi:MAG: hypothetical protein AMXMBFR61_00590 [Fimbriimonadales bacterium]